MSKEKSEYQKVLDLLNEYETPRSGVVYKSYDDYDGFFYGVDCDGETEIAWSDSLICSKKFGFIKWLVDNEKVEESRPIEEERIYTQEELLLMELAIQDNPIEFLISILK